MSFLNSALNVITSPLRAITHEIPNLITGRDNRDQSNALAVQSDREWAETQAQKQMDFQREMSNTAWQRGVEDMKQAGLNPALALFQGGASSAAGAMAGTSSTDQKAELQRERMMFQLANSALQVAGQAIPRSSHRTITHGWH